MLTLILKRLGIGLITVFAVSLIIFFGTKILPGDAAQIRLGQSATPENMAKQVQEAVAAVSGKEFLKSVDQVFDNAAKSLKLSDYLAAQIKSPNATYKVNFGVSV